MENEYMLNAEEVKKIIQDYEISRIEHIGTFEQIQAQLPKVSDFYIKLPLKYLEHLARVKMVEGYYATPEIFLHKDGFYYQNLACVDGHMDYILVMSRNVVDRIRNSINNTKLFEESIEFDEKDGNKWKKQMVSLRDYVFYDAKLLHEQLIKNHPDIYPANKFNELQYFINSHFLYISLVGKKSPFLNMDLTAIIGDFTGNSIVKQEYENQLLGNEHENKEEEKYDG